ncbi:ran-binding protein m [Anaeramoeba ignava]|uniref:Ran-binding protein m n=1 Tax=Anaeramoeba ignava TaxID=1746090 RepID=A0A9Q0LRE7_ANAIG|nr:ran-binding protein m [Anaeramoeba ignava]
MALPVRKCVLFRHGIGYFEREEEIEGDQNLVLSFKEDVMNDVLKSLTTYDDGQGYVSGISYEGIGEKKPNILINLDSSKSMSQLMAETQGAKVSITYGGEAYKGIILGIEAKKKTNDEKQNQVIETEIVSILTEENQVRSFDLMEVEDVEFLDEEIKRDLQHLLDVLISSKKKSVKNVTVFCKGKKKRNFRATYIIPLPVWKTSYRVMLGAKEPILQGWAIVDNTTEEDWKNIKLELVSGLPVSFIHDLYSPRFQVRPKIEVQDEAAFAPPVLEQSIERLQSFGESLEMEMAFDDMGGDLLSLQANGPPPMMAMSMMAPKMPSMMGRGMHRNAKPTMVSKEKKMEAFTQSVQPDVQTRKSEAVDLCHYSISVPVSVKRDQSALVPIYQGNFGGEQVCVYNESVRAKNPMSTILFKNTTGLILEGGPITMYEKGEYIGEGMLDTIQPNDEKLISYAVELGCIVSSNNGVESQSIHQSVVNNGILSTQKFYYYWRKYEINNKSTKKLDFILEHPFTYQTQLFNTMDPYEKTDSYYRFRFPVPPKQKIVFVVVERKQISDTFYLDNLNERQIVNWHSQKLIDQKTKEILQELAIKFQIRQNLSSQISITKSELNEHFQNQRRITQNMKSLRDSSDQRKLRDRYVQELTTSEDEIETLRAKIKEHEKNLRVLQTQLTKELNAIRYETFLNVPKAVLPQSQIKIRAEKLNQKLTHFHEKVDEALPSGFDEDYIRIGIEHSSELRTIHDKRETDEECIVRSNFPIPDSVKIYYFEMTVEDPGTSEAIGIGAVPDDHNLKGMPGWENSIGYHGDDGNLFFCDGKGQEFGPTYSKNDTVGFGLDRNTKNAFFTHNGKLIKIVPDNKFSLFSKTLYPAIGLHSKNAKISVNFGTIPFLYKLESKY